MSKLKTLIKIKICGWLIHSWPGQIQQVARAGLEPGTAGLRVRRADHSATLPPVPPKYNRSLYRRVIEKLKIQSVVETFD